MNPYLVMQVLVEMVGSSGVNIGLEHDVSSSGGELTTVPVPNIFQSIPTICEAILENNLKGQLLFHLEHKHRSCGKAVHVHL